MRDYELVLIIRPEVADDALEGVIGKVQGAITSGGGEVSEVNVWGRRRLAFSIKLHRHGIYAVINMKMSPAATRELERGLFLSEEVIRHLLVLAEKVPPKRVMPATAQATEEEKEQSNDGGDTQ